MKHDNCTLNFIEKSLPSSNSRSESLLY